MFKIEQTNIIFSEVIDYNSKKDIIYYKDIAVFSSIDKLVNALAYHHHPVLNWNFEPIPGQFRNIYLEAQTLTGIKNRCPLLDDDILGYFMFNPTTGIGKYMFCWNVPGRPYLDVRILKKEIEKKYFENVKEAANCKNRAYRYRQDELNLKQCTNKKFNRRKRHKAYEWRDDARYIHRGRAASGMMTEPEYKEFVKPKDRWMKNIWKDEEFCSKGGRSSGWKDNSGYKYRHQWEVKAAREYKKAKKNKKCIFG